MPIKFKADKRKSHLSNLIFSGQITKEEALLELKQPAYSNEQLKIDKPFVLKKLGFSEEWFEEYLKAPAVDHSLYGYTKALSDEYPILKIIKPVKKLLSRNMNSF